MRLSGFNYDFRVLFSLSWRKWSSSSAVPLGASFPAMPMPPFRLREKQPWPQRTGLPKAKKTAKKKAVCLVRKRGASYEMRGLGASWKALSNEAKE